MKAYQTALILPLFFASCASPATTGMPAVASARSAVAAQFLYVASAKSISVYPTGGTAPVRTLPADEPLAMAFDRSGNLYVANHNGGPSGRGYVSVFAPGSDTPERTISNGINIPYSLAFDSENNLYVANYIRSLSAPKTTGSITVYKPGRNVPYRTIARGVNHPHQVVIAANDELVVATNTQLRFYSAGKDEPKKSVTVRTTLAALGLDGTNHIFAGVNNGCPNYCFSAVLVYLAPGSYEHRYFFDDDTDYGGYIPTGFAFDSTGNIYIALSEGAGQCCGSVAVFPPLPEHPSYPTYSLWGPETVSVPMALAIDAKDNLYVGDDGRVEEYQAHTQANIYTIKQGISGQVTALAIASE